MKPDAYRLKASVEYLSRRLLKSLKPGSYGFSLFRRKWGARLSAIRTGYGLDGIVIWPRSTTVRRAAVPYAAFALTVVFTLSADRNYPVSVPAQHPVEISENHRPRPTSAVEPAAGRPSEGNAAAAYDGTSSGLRPRAETDSVEAAKPLARAKPAPAVAVAPSVEAWRRHAVAWVPRSDRPMIAVVIDDMGIDRKRTARIIALPGPLTTSFLSYANDLEVQTGNARMAGHELMLHIPMEPERPRRDAGYNVLETSLPDRELMRRLLWSLNRFDGFVGINNHMGSRFTADRKGMYRVMRLLKERGLLFLDSRTTPKTVAAEIANELGVSFVKRDVFLDDTPTPAGLARQMREAESIARREGAVVVIGHPRDATIVALRQWLAHLEERGFALVPLSAIARLSSEGRSP